jgi:hypothetical protein
MSRKVVCDGLRDRREGVSDAREQAEGVPPRSWGRPAAAEQCRPRSAGAGDSDISRWRGGANGEKAV